MPILLRIAAQIVSTSEERPLERQFTVLEYNKVVVVCAGGGWRVASVSDVSRGGGGGGSAVGVELSEVTTLDMLECRL